MSTNSTSPNGVGELPFTPLLTPAIIFAVIFGLLLGVQCIFACRFWRYYGNAIGMLSGLLLELLGYIAKVKLARDRHNKNGYIMYIIGLTLGPTFLSSALYLSISALLRKYPLIKIKPHWFSTLFILGDFICLCFIGVGGSLAAIFAESPVGINLMISGLATQIAFTLVFCIVLTILFRRMGKRQARITPKLLRYGMMLGAAAACLFVRSCWRAAELSGGFNGPLASKEGVFIALDSIPMAIMSVLLLVLHPGFWFQESCKEISSLGSFAAV